MVSSLALRPVVVNHTTAEPFFCSLLLDWHQRELTRLKDKQKVGNPFDLGSLAFP